MVSGPEDDFASFLDFGDLNFSGFGDGSVSGTPQASGDGADGSAMDMSMEGGGNAATGMISHPGIQQNTTPLANPMNGFQEAFTGLGSPVPFIARQQSHQQAQAQMQMQQQARYYGHSAVPPTPNSLELHGSHPEYFNPADRQQQIMFEHYRRHYNEQVRESGVDESR